MNDSGDNLVYSTQHGKPCKRCGRPLAGCVCAREAEARARAAGEDAVLRVGRETKGRKGAGVTVVTGVPLAGKQLKLLAKQLKARCGSGGTVGEADGLGRIEVQGEHRDTLVAELEKRGYEVRRSGG